MPVVRTTLEMACRAQQWAGSAGRAQKGMMTPFQESHMEIPRKRSPSSSHPQSLARSLMSPLLLA